jgi:DNA-binding beta-propeller fold protein YncE
MKRSAMFVFVVAVTSICSGQWLERQVVIGDTFGGIRLTGGIVVNPTSGNVYIESDPIQIFNPVTREKLRGPGALGIVVFCPASGKGYILGDSAVIIDAAADTVIGTAPLPSSPYVLAYNSTLNRLYLSTYSDEGLLVFDPDGDSIMDTVDMGGAVRTLLWDSAWNRVYAGTGSSGQLKVMDCTGDTLLAEIELGLDRVRGLALSTVSHKLYCAGDPDTAVVIVSTDSLTAIGAVPGLTRPDTMVYGPSTDRLYCPAEDSLFVIDCQGDTIRARLGAPVASLAASSLSGSLYLGRYDSAQVLVVDTNDQVVDSIPLPTVPSHYIAALGFWPHRNELYGVTNRDLAFIVDASVDTVAGGVSYAAYQPRQMVHNPAGNKLYMLCPGHDEILVLDSTFGTPKHILGGAVDSDALPVLNHALNRLYVADYHSLRVIDCNSDSLLRSIALAGVSRPRPVMVPYLNKLYVFDDMGSGDYVYAYDCLRDTAVRLFGQDDDVTCAVYDPRSNHIFFACEDAPTLRVLDPVTDSVVKTFDLVGGSYRGAMALNLDLGRLYYTDQSPELMFTIDLLSDSIVGVESLPWDIDTMFLNRRLGKLYMCSRGTAAVLVFDCNQGAMVDTVYAGFRYTGLMNDRNDKLYLRYGAVVDCRYDSVVTRLDSINPRSMAWDAIHNRVFQATTSRLYVYRDDLSGVEDRPVGPPEQRFATIVRGVLLLPEVENGAPENRRLLLDVCGRKVLDLRPGRNDVRALPVGVYFVRQVVGGQTTKVVVQR